MKALVQFLFPLLAFALLSGCTLITPASPTATATYPPPITTEPALPTLTPVQATETSVPTPSPTPFQPFEALVAVDYLNLRSGPGITLDSLGMYSANEKVSVLGRAPGYGWMYVRAADGKQGWFRMELLNLQGHNYYDAPEVEPDGFVIVRGHVYTPNGNPASHITVILKPEGDPDEVNAVSATTDVLGRYYFFLPAGTKGSYELYANAYGPESNAVNSAGNLIGTFPPGQVISFKTSPDVWYNIQLLP